MVQLLLISLSVTSLIPKISVSKQLSYRCSVIK